MSSQQSWDSGGGLCWQSHNSLSEWSSEDRDDELALFQDMVSRERRNFLHNPSSWEDIDTSLNSMAEFGGVSPLTPHEDITDLLSSDGEKNDYEWLIAPPEAPLFPSLDNKESPKLSLSQGRALPALKTSRVSRSQEPSRRSLGRNYSPGRPSTASSTNSAYSPSRRTLSASPRPTLRSSKPSARAYPSSRGPSPVAARRSLTQTLQGSADTPSTNRSGNATWSRNGRNPPSPKLQSPKLHSPKLQSFHPEFFIDARHNLRTSVPDFSAQSSDLRRQSITACFEGTEMNGGKQQPVSLNFSRSSFSSFSHDHFSSQTSKDSISSSCDDDTDIIQSLGLDNDDLISLDFIDEDLVSSTEQNLATAGKYTNPSSKQQSKGNRISATSKRSANIPYSKKYSGPISRQVDSGRNSQKMFRPLLSSVPASSFYSMRPIAAHNRQPLQLTHATAENTEHSIVPLPESEPEPNPEQFDENKKVEMMESLSCENSAKQLALEELEEEKLQLANPRRLDFGISSCNAGVNSGESVDSCEIKDFDIASSASTGWKPEISLDADTTLKTCVTKSDMKKQDFVNDGSMDIDTNQVAAAVHYGEENRNGLLIDILKEDNTCGGTHPEHIQGINNIPKEKGSVSEPLEPEIPMPSRLSGHVQKESTSLDPQRTAYLHQGPRSHNLSYNELHLSSPYQDAMKYRSFCHRVSKSNSSKSNSLNSSKGHDLHLSQETVDLPNRYRAVLKPASATGSSNLQRSRDSIDKELASLIPMKQQAERKSNSLNGDLMLAMAIRRSNSINLEVNNRSLDGVNGINRIINLKENAGNLLKKQQNMAQDEASRKGTEAAMSVLLKRESLPANQSELFSEEGYCDFTDDQEATVVTTDSHDLEMLELDMKSSMPVLCTDTDTDAELQGSFLHLSKFPMCGSSEQIDTGMVETDPIDESVFTGLPVDNEGSNNKHVAMDEDSTDIVVLQTSSRASDFDTGEIQSVSNLFVDGIAEHSKDSSMDSDDRLLDSSSAKAEGFSVITSDHSSETLVQNGSVDEPDCDNLPVKDIEQNSIPGNRKCPSRPYSISLEEATTTVLFCSSIVHDAVYRAVSIAMEKEATATATATATPIPTAELMITSQSIFTSNKIFRPGKRKGQSMADSTTRATKTLTYKQNQKASFSSITVQQNPIDKTGNTIIGNEEKPIAQNHEELVVIPTPAKAVQKDKMENKGGVCKCSCTIM